MKRRTVETGITAVNTVKANRSVSLLRIMLVLLMVVSYLLCIVSYKNLRGVQDTVTILCSTDTIKNMDGNTYENILEQEAQRDVPTDFAMWQESDGGNVKAENSGRSAEVTVMRVRGKMSVLFGEFAPLTQEDMQGCCLDEQTALALFGSMNVIGNQLNYENKTYIVRGVLRDYGGLIVLRPGTKELTDRITIKITADTSSTAQSREFMSQYGIAGHVLNHVMLKEVVQLFPLLLPLCIGIWLLVSIRSNLKRDVHCRSDRYLCYGILVLTLVVLIATLVRFLQIPKDMIPTRWSDFQFWSNWLETFKEQVSVYIRYPKGIVEVESLWVFIRCAVRGILPVVLFMGVGLAGKRPKRKF